MDHPRFPRTPGATAISTASTCGTTVAAACGMWHPAVSKSGILPCFHHVRFIAYRRKKGNFYMNFYEFLHSCSYFDDTKWIDSGLYWEQVLVILDNI